MLAVRLEVLLFSLMLLSILEYRSEQHQRRVKAGEKHLRGCFAYGVEIGETGEHALNLAVSPDTLAEAP